MPPLAGFAGKALLFGAALDGGFGWLAVVAIGNSVLSLAVYLRVVVALYQTPAGERRAAGPVVGVWACALVLTVGLGLAVQVVVGRIG